MCYGGMWKNLRVCNRTWGVEEAKVVCRQLGFSGYVNRKFYIIMHGKNVIVTNDNIYMSLTYKLFQSTILRHLICPIVALNGTVMGQRCTF